MNTLTRWQEKWNPFKEMEDLHNRLSSILTRNFGSDVSTREGNESITWPEWAPLVDITEDEKEYLIKAELPEVTKKDLKVTVENGLLTIAGERKFEKQENGKRYHRVERAYGSFTRRFSVPEDADPAKVTAEFKDGVLLVRLQKDEKAKPRSVDVQIG